jgi:hypothetical protein
MHHTNSVRTVYLNKESSNHVCIYSDERSSFEDDSRCEIFLIKIIQ